MTEDVRMFEFKLPDLGEGITEAEIISWDVKEGDTVAEHQPIAQVETDKAIVPVPAPVTGTVKRLHHAAGDTVRVGEVLVSFETAGAEPPASHAAPAVAARSAVAGNGGKTGAPTAADPTAPTTVDQDAGSVVGRLTADDGKHAAGEVLAAPAVRRLARRYGVELERVTGTGLGGRVTEADVRRHAEKEGKPAPGVSSPGTPAVAARPAAPTVHPHVAYAATPPSAAAAAGSVIEHTEFGPVEKRPLRGVRRAISRHLSHAARVVVPVTVTDEADATELATRP
jgi:pyruvate dehydrogenase E2 component (dihydrolipoamide acetyltransferase)